MVDVKARLRVGCQDPLLLPIPQKASGSGVSVVGVVVTRFIAIEDQSNDVRRVSLIQCVLQFRSDHVVGWGDDVTEAAHMAQIVAQPAEMVVSLA